MGETRNVKNVVHEMSIWKQLIENEHRTAKEWDANWGFLKMMRSSNNGKAQDGADTRNVSKTEEVDLAHYGEWSVSLAKTLSRGHESTRQAISTFLDKQSRVPNYTDVVRQTFEPFDVKSPSSDDLDRITVEIAVRRVRIDLFEISYKSTSAKANGSSRLVTPRLAATPRLVTPRSGGREAGGSRLATPRMTAAGMAVVQDVHGAGATQLQGGGDTKRGTVQPNSPPTNPMLELAERCGDKRLKVIANMTKTPKDRFGRQILTSHEFGWGRSLEKFGVNHHGKTRNEELWPEV